MNNRTITRYDEAFQFRRTAAHLWRLAGRTPETDLARYKALHARACNLLDEADYLDPCDPSDRPSLDDDR